MRASVVLSQPGAHAVSVEPVLARQERDFGTDLDVVHTYRTFGLPVVTKHALIYFPSRQCFYRGSRRGTGRVAAGVLLHELGNDSVERLLRIDGVSGSGVRGIEHSCEHGERPTQRAAWHVGPFPTSAASTAWTQRG